jgi:hypothetical protein
VYEISRVGPYSGARTSARSRRRWPWAVGLVLLVVLGVLAFGFFAWPQGAIAADSLGLAKLSKPSFGSSNVQVTAATSANTPIQVSVRPDGVIWPAKPIPPGTLMHVDVTIKRPGWVSWLTGGTEHLRLWVRAPKTDLQQDWLLVKPGSPVKVAFGRPVTAVQLTGAGKPSVRLLPRPSKVVSLGNLGVAGAIGVSAVGRRWERFPVPARVTWFRDGGRPEVLTTPSTGTALAYDTPLTLQFSKPVNSIFSGKQKVPWAGKIPGSWKQTDAHTLVFTPYGFGWGVDTAVKVHLPRAVEQVGRTGTTRLLGWTTPTGTTLRLHQLLAQLGYLPLTWTATTGDAGPTFDAQIQAVANPPAGTFSWRYGNTPSELTKLWSPKEWNSITRGAVMAFESDNDLLTDGYAGRNVWQALIAATLAGKKNKYDGYSFVIVHRNQRPQSLVVWHNGVTEINTPANTGIPQAPTVLGVFPVYARFVVTTMRGTNPDGTKYADPGIPWVSYFNGGDAIHGFTRASYGSPQSLGCVELPASEAAQVFPFTPIGTLVDVAS